MSTFTAQQIIDRAAELADMQDGFIAPATWLNWLNDERQSLDLFIAQHGWIQEQSTATLTANSTTNTLAITSPIAIIGVWEQNSNGRYRRLSVDGPIDHLHQDPLTGPVTGAAVTWMPVRRSNTEDLTINFWPRPTSGTYICYYIPRNADLTSLGDQITYPLRWEKRLILGMVWNALVKEDSDTGKIDKAIQKMDSQIEKACWDRQIGETPIVRNSDSTYRGWSNWTTFPPPTNWYWV
jgi:hypothetical protein